MSRHSENIHFQGFAIREGFICQSQDAAEAGPAQQIEVWGWNQRHNFIGNRKGTYYGIVAEGVAVVQTDSQRHELLTGAYFALHQNVRVIGGKGIVIFVPEYFALQTVGGPAEPLGRLKYIDGCSDTLLIHPPVKGQPCLNLLHLPENINQTLHTHPSDRIGIILSGKGVCRTPKLDGAGEDVHQLAPGMFWRIPREGEHHFFTEPGQHLQIFAWHPDSDWGPDHDSHPMLNRTYVNGAPVDPNADIRTTELKQ